MNNTTTPTIWNRTLTAGVVASCALVGVGLIGLDAFGEEEGSGDIATLTIANTGADAVTGLTLESDMDVRVRVDPNATQHATLRIDDNLVDDVEAWLDDDGALHVGWADDLVGVEPTQQPLLVLHVQDLDSVENRSDGTVTVTGVDKADLAMENEGDGSIEVLR